MTVEDDAFRADVLRARGAAPEEVDALLAYTASRFAAPDPLPDFPLADEPHLADWERYAGLAEARGAWPVLSEALVQLRFPVATGMADDAAYQAATRRGATAPADAPPPARAEGIRLFLHPTPAGRVPVVVAEARADFERLVRSLTRRNEPSPVPASMGACIVGGYANWERVARLRARWEAERGAMDDAAFFRALKGDPAAYQDRFVILSAGPYSGVPAGEMGMDEEEWRAVSVVIRREHECAHYFTRRVLGAMSNALHDELVADFAGIVAAAGRFRAGWLFRFLGVEEDGTLRPGGRLENYRGTPPLPEGAFRVLGALVAACAPALEAAGEEMARAETPAERAAVLLALATTPLEALAAEDGAARLLRRLPAAAQPA